MTKPIWQMSAVETATAIRSKSLSCEAVVAAHVDHMRAVNKDINAVVVDLGGVALEQARATDAALANGAEYDLLTGVPVTIKINTDLAGQANSNGVPVLAGLVAKNDAPVVENLKNAGAIVIGMTNTPEFSLRIVTDNPLHGLTLNPWDKGVTCGGSSGGAGAAIAAGIGAIAQGNDIGGSLRWPAHCNGITTIRPTAGRIPNHNNTAQDEGSPAAQLFSSHGPLARSVEDVRLGLEVMSRGNIRDPNWVPAPLRGPTRNGPIKVALVKVPDDMEPDPAQLAHVAKAADYLAQEGYIVEEIEIPQLGYMWDQWANLLITEIRTLRGPALAQFASPDFNTVYKVFKDMTVDLDKVEYMQALSERLTFLRKWMAILDEYPIILTPVFVHDAISPRADLDGHDRLIHIMRQGMRFIGIINYLGLPASIVPVGLQDGHPVGVQLIASRFREDMALDAAAAVEKHAGLLVRQLWDRAD